MKIEMRSVFMILNENIIREIYFFVNDLKILTINSYAKKIFSSSLICSKLLQI